MKNRKIVEVKNILCSFFIVLLLAFASCKTITAPVEIVPDFTGVIPWQSNTAEEYALLDRIGATWLLSTFYWSRIEREDDQWNFERYDKYVDMAKAEGKKLLGVLGYSNEWIHDDGKWPYYIPPDKLHYFIDYVRHTAAHYKGRVDAWCIWNEPNFIFWEGSKKEFYELTRQAAEAIREEDPDVIILGGAFNRGVFGLPRSFIRGLFESGSMEKVNGVAFHPYELNPKRSQKLFRRFEKLCARYGFDEVWSTETGYPTGGWYPTAVKEERFPEFVVKTYVYLAVEGASRVIWYQLFDPDERVKRNSEHFFGLVRSINDYTSKGAEAFRLCSLYLAGTTYSPITTEKFPQSLKAYYFEKNESPGGKALVLWKSGLPIKFNMKIPGGGLLHDPVTGEAVEINSETVISAGVTPIFITWQENENTAGEPKLQRVR